MDPILDFRSDTLTKPSEAMRRAMAAAEVGDDVFREDPTVARLEETVAGLFGREAALFVPSGTMANLIAVGLHCRRGEEVVLERRTHTFSYEGGALSGLMGAMAAPVDCEEGWLTAAALEPAIRGEDVHWPRTKLAIVEDTANLAGGRVVPLGEIAKIGALCRRRGLALHVDGARVWNAAAAGGGTLADIAALADTLSCCLSKGLGCPVGSLLVGDAAAIAEARRLRKQLGGGMRQAGMLAAAGLHALDEHLPNLADDHQLAREIAHALRLVTDDELVVESPETNMIRVHAGDALQRDSLLARWGERGVRALPLGERSIRLVTHRDLPGDAAGQLRARLG